MSDPALDEFRRRVEAAAEGTPYVVTGTEKGFDVTLDIVDAQWFGIFNKAGLAKVYIHHVAMPKSGVYTITDESRELEWVAGVPSMRASVTRVRGRVVEFGATKVWAFDAEGRFGVQADYRFGSEEGRDLITGVAQQLQLTSRRGLEERIGLYVGMFAAVGSVITVIVLVVLALGGYFEGA